MSVASVLLLKVALFLPDPECRSRSLEVSFRMDSIYYPLFLTIFNTTLMLFQGSMALLSSAYWNEQLWAHFSLSYFNVISVRA